MKSMLNCIFLTSCLLAAGCVRRTITVEPQYANPVTAKKYSSNHSKIVDQKTIWFWQDGFRNPEK